MLNKVLLTPLLRNHGMLEHDAILRPLGDDCLAKYFQSGLDRSHFERPADLLAGDTYITWDKAAPSPLRSESDKLVEDYQAGGETSRVR